MRRPTTVIWDRLGILLSLLCLVHCLVLPLLLAGLSVWNFLEGAHLWLALAVAPVTLLAAVPGYRRHGRREVLWLLSVDVVGLFVALPAGHAAGALAEQALTSAAGFLLVAGHWINTRAGHDHDAC